MKPTFGKLFEPAKIGNLRIKNRIVKAPQACGYGSVTGEVTDRQLRYYKNYAIGEVGLVIVEIAYIGDEASKAIPTQLGVSHDKYIPGLARLAEAIKENGARAALQLHHCGRFKFIPEPPYKAPSSIPWPEIYEQAGKILEAIPDELTIEEIHKITESFGDAAVRAKKAGFDMVEVHGAHGYLITGFLSPRNNRRTDMYGGPLEDRMRFLVDVIENIRGKVGPDFPLGVRLVGTDYEPGGIEIEETKKVAQKLEELDVNVLHISGGDDHMMEHQVSPMYFDRGYNVWAAKEIKDVVNIPVIASGSLNTPEVAVEVLEKEKADFVSFGRPLFADPHFPKKLLEDRREDIVPCIRCNDGCLGRLFETWHVRCSVNPELGKEGEYDLSSVEKPRRVAVVGGGPGGMEAARVCALRGHEVTLYEKRELGGRLIEASQPEFKTDIRDLIEYYRTQIKKLDIEVRLEEATPRTIKEGDFDAAIIAIGGAPIVPDVPGIDSPIVLSARDALMGEKELGEKISVIGGGLVGAETALFLAEKGKDISIIEMLPRIMADVKEFGTVRTISKRITQKGVKIHTNRRLDSVAEDSIVIVDQYGNKETIEVENIVLASGFAPQPQFAKDLIDSGIEAIEIGDCVDGRKIHDAIHEGSAAARRL